MTTYYEGPNTVAELLARYREVKRRLHPAASPAAPVNSPSKTPKASLRLSLLPPPS